MWWITVGLILAGIVLMFIEMLLLSGGFAGVACLACFGAATWYTFDKMGPVAGRWVLLFVLVLLIIMIIIMLREKTWRKFSLKEDISSQVNKEVEKVSVGDKGVTLSRLAPIGSARFESISCEVKSHDGSMLASGTAVVVVAIVDNQVLVKPVNQ